LLGVCGWREPFAWCARIARDLADESRDAWESLVPARVDADGDGKQDDRDEVAMAFTKHGGRKGRERPLGVAYVAAADNRGPGNSIGGRLRKYCNGTHFKVKPFGGRTRTVVIVLALRDGRQVRQVQRRRR
jgi:hypothetical protein